jgi:hypothetical protein
MGDGAATVVISAKGSIRLMPWTGHDSGADRWIRDLERLTEEVDRQVNEALSDIDFASLGQQVDQRVNEALQDIDFAGIAQQVESRVAWAEHNLDRVDWERLGREARKAAEAGISQAQEAIQRALLRMKAREPGAADPEQPATPAPEDEAVTSAGGRSADEEQMAILRMVERGQITPDEGEMLLDSLED